MKTVSFLENLHHIATERKKFLSRWIFVIFRRFRNSEENRKELQRVNEELRQINTNLENRVAEKTLSLAGVAAIVEYSNDAIVGANVDHQITSWNPAAQRMFGYTTTEVLGKTIYDFVSKDRYAEMHELLRRTSIGATPEVLDFVILAKDGTPVEVSLTISPIKSSDGAFVGTSFISREISSRKQFEQDLQKSEARKAAILNASLEAIITIDHVGKILDWNTMAEKTFGFSCIEAVGKELAELIIPPRYRKAHVDGLAHFMKTGSGRVIGKRIELSALKSNGEEFPVELSIAAIETEDGPPLFTASIRDITGNLKAAEALKKNEIRFKHVVEAAPNGFLMVDQKGKIVLCNKEFEALFGYDRSELIGQEMEFLVPQRFRRAHPGHRASFLANPETRQMGAGRDLFGLRKDGTEFPVEIGLNPLATEDGAFVLASVVDITKRKNLEDRIRQSSAAIQQKNQEMEEFVYTVSHDLKSPLVTSTGFLGLLKEDFVARKYDNIMDSVVRLEKANARMSQLIDDLLQLSRIGRLGLQIELVDISTMVKGICENLATQIKEKSAEVVIHEGAPAIQADRKRLYQVFENLIINALKYGCENPHPKIEIGFEQAENEFRFYVKDNGRGIAEEYHKKIFGLFQRLESDSRGTGVGLTIVSRIMHFHNGKVWVDSGPGQGATFWLAFPKNINVKQEVEYE